MRRTYHAQTEPDGIIFYSELIPDLSVYAKGPKIDVSSKETENSFLERNYEVIVSIFAIVSLIVIIGLRNFCDTIRIIAFFYGTIHLMVLLDAILNVSSQTKRLHAAEHMVLNAWQKTSSIPSIDDIRKFSKLSPNCGICYVSTRIFFAMSIFILTSLLGIYILFFIPFLYVSSHLLRVLHFFNWIEYGVTKNPTNKELEIAIAGLKALVEKETEMLDSI